MLAGLVLGAALGAGAHVAFAPERLETFLAVTEPAGRLFLRLLFMLVIPLILSALPLGVAGLGTIAPGAPADLLVFREDPTASLDALASLAAVIRDGRLYPRESLDAQLALYRAHYDGALYDAVVTPLVRRALAATRR